QLHLPDPERTISRVHARVLFRAGGYAIVDNGSNPVSVNGSPLGAGREQAIQPGDQIQIGAYVLEVAVASLATPSNRLDELFGDVNQGLAAAPASPGPAASVMHTWPTSPPTSAGVSSIPSTPGRLPDDWDPFGDEPPPGSGGAPRAAAASGNAGQTGQTGLTGLDAWAASTAPSAGSALDDWPGSGTTPGAGQGLGLGGPGSSIDDLFGLGEPARPTPGAARPGADDTLQALLGGPLPPGPNTAADVDPLRALGQAARIAPASHADRGSELNTPMPLARASNLTAGAVFSWDAPPSAPRAAPPHPSAARPPEAMVRPAATRQPALPAASGPTPRAAPSALSTGATGGGAFTPASGETELLLALRQGLGTPELPLQRLTPALLLVMGQCLRGAVAGSLDLLAARAAVKHEMRAGVTLASPSGNNPLKFAPTPEIALQQLLGPPLKGFMPADRAMRDTFEDLLAHQLGVMAGMRAALAEVLKRFDPAQLEGKISRRSPLGQLIPAARKARLWELYQELFGQISAEAQDDFDELFGKAFLQAYEAQLDQLAEARRPPANASAGLSGGDAT
ncbi:MAG: type secretion system-associated domain protein TagH, partial [Pseudomonadota bacterium]